MTTFVYIEDRDLETGHGWRDHKFEIDDYPRFPRAWILDDDGERTGDWNYAECSYAWITTLESWQKSGFPAEDCLRTYDIRDAIREFDGCDDMEGHFEFKMNPEEMHRHLQQLGIEPAKEFKTWSS